MLWFEAIMGIHVLSNQYPYVHITSKTIHIPLKTVVNTNLLDIILRNYIL